MTINLRRFWFNFDNTPEFSPLRLGCGVTAFDSQDAIKILSATVFFGRESIPISSVNEDIDIRTLDENHVLPNIGNVVIRGVWFPIGFEIPK
jgi:hypothetical protein